ncbi:MAG TPA: hypothetical protein VGN12_09770 [Pirellulales bacterium]
MTGNHEIAIAKNVCRRGVRALTVMVVILAAAQAGAGDVLVERRTRLEQMDQQDREQVSQNFERFQRLEPAERDRLRELHDEIDADPQRDELLKVMQNYHEWLNELPASQRIMLAALPVEDRIKRIDELRGAQAAGKRNRLSPADSKALDAWIVKHDFHKQWADAQRNSRPPSVTPEQLADLRNVLSEPAQKALDEAKTEEEQRRLVRGWIFQTRAPGWGAGGRGGFHRPSTEELHQLFTNDLSESERSYLRALPPEQMQRELVHLWREHHAKQGDGPHDRSDGRGPMNRRGGKADHVSPDRPARERDSKDASAP